MRKIQRAASVMSERQQHRDEQILKLLLKKGSVTVDELIERLDASAPSIRRDLTRLEQKGLIRRTHGGATLVQELLYRPFRYDTAFESRQHRFVKEKRHIGLAAAELVVENETVGLTAGTTTTWVARSLRHRNNLTIITNAVNIGMELCNMPGLKIHLTGGYVHWPWSFSLIGAAAVSYLGNTFLDKLFLSVSGIDPSRGTTTNESDEALTFRAMVKQAKEVIVVADSSKLGVVTPSLICPIEDVDVLVTDEGASEEMIEAFHSQDVRVIRA
ncbi:MAG TPA: DeoR/GlpR family DNA-binding transcription regulator [Terriglobia bacterium]|nr:DeoR/GlpR family DNA-binding transcription regulator [Terriglobia bacterium]